MIIYYRYTKYAHNIFTDQEIDHILEECSEILSLTLFEKSENLGPTIYKEIEFSVELVEFWEMYKKCTFKNFQKFLKISEIIVYILYTKIYTYIVVYIYSILYICICMHVYVYMYMYLTIYKYRIQF